MLLLGIAIGIIATRWYDRSPKAHRIIFWLWTRN